MQLDLSTLRERLHTQYDFSIAESLTTIARHYTTSVDRYAINGFLSQNGHELGAPVIDAIIRRLDHTGDGLIHFEEMVEAMRPANRPGGLVEEMRPGNRTEGPVKNPEISVSTNQLSRSKKRNRSTKNLSKKKNKSFQRSTSKSLQRSMSKSMTRSKSPSWMRVPSPFKYTTSIRTAPSPDRSLRKSMSAISSTSSIRTTSPRKARNSSQGNISTNKLTLKSSKGNISARKQTRKTRHRQRQTKKVPRHTAFANLLMKQLEFSRNIENAKQALSARRDFTLDDLYHIGRIPRDGMFADDMSNLLAIFRIYVYRDEAEILFRHHAHESSRLSLQQFSKLFIPKHPYHAQIIKDRV